MRTKTILCAAALAAGVASSMAQVYSLNVVGYVNVPYTDVGNFYLSSVPVNSTNNTLKELLPTCPDGTIIGLWSTANQDFSSVSPFYSTSDNNWHPNINLAPGQGFFVGPAGPFTNTYVGEVKQGSVTNAILGGGNFDCIGSSVPLGGGFSNVLDQYPALDGDVIGIWSEPAQDFSSISPFYSTSDNKWHPDFPTVNFNVADGFFLARGGGPVNYVRTFSVP